MEEYTNHNDNPYIYKNLKESSSNLFMSLMDQNKLNNDNILLQNNLTNLENSNSILKEENM